MKQRNNFSWKLRKILMKTQVQSYQNVINIAKDQTMMKTWTCKVLKCEKSKESIWFNNEIEKEIKFRNKYNREKRLKMM